MLILWLIITGLGFGVVGAMGLGGGTLLIPVLTLFLNIPQKIAQSINLLSFLPMAIVALFMHLKNKLIDFKTFFSVGISGSAFAVLGSLLMKKIQAPILRQLFAGLIIVLAIIQIIFVIIEIIKKRRNKKNTPKI